MERKKWSSSIKWGVFFPPLFFTILICVFVATDPEKAGKILEAGFSFVTNQFAWFFEWYYVVVFAILIAFCLMPIGKKKLGDGKTEYSTKSWLGMMFTTTAGLGLLTWGTIEWFYYSDAPMWGMAKGAPETITLATAVPLYHWGPMAISCYTLMAVAFAYLFFVKKSNDCRPSTACVELIGDKRANGIVGTIIDILFAVPLLCAVTTCVGVNVPTVFGLVGSLTGKEPGFGLQIGVIMAWSVIMAILLTTGLKKGVRYLSDFRVIVGFSILAVILVFGPTFKILNGFTDSIGAFLNNFVKLSFNTDSQAKSLTPQGWTIFYWTWNLSMAIPNGIFFAKISKGRTIRSLILGSILAQTVGAFLFFMVFTQFSVITVQQYGMNIGNIVKESGQGVAIVEIWSKLPFAKVLIPILLVFAFLCMQTLLNGNAYSMAMATTKTLKESEEPPCWNRIFWSICIGAISISLLLIGGIRPFQTIAVISGVPSAIIVAMVFISFVKSIKKEEKDISTAAKQDVEHIEETTASNTEN